MNTLALISGMPGPTELFIIFALLFLLFGGKKLPELARGVGKSIVEFKKARREIEDTGKDIEKSLTLDDK